jgi:hypothetical protein
MMTPILGTTPMGAIFLKLAGTSPLNTASVILKRTFRTITNAIVAFEAIEYAMLT